MTTRGDRSVGWPVKTTSAWDGAPIGHCYASLKKAPRNQSKSAVKTPLTIIAKKQQQFQKRKQTDWFGGDWQSAHHAFLVTRSCFLKPIRNGPFRTPT